MMRNLPLSLMGLGIAALCLVGVAGGLQRAFDLVESSTRPVLPSFLEEHRYP